MKKKVSFEEALQLLKKDNPNVSMIELEDYLQKQISIKKDGKKC